MVKENEKAPTDGTYADGDLVRIPLVNLELGPNYRSQLRDMDSLVESVYQFGVLTPLWVEPHPSVPNKYVIFAGRRRYEAARQAALRHAKESKSGEALAVQVGRYTVPCRIFRNLRKAQQAVFSLLENVARSDPSARDTAVAMARARKLVEEQLGRKVSIDDMMTLFEGAGRHEGKSFHRRHVYRLLRIGEMDPKVLETARGHSLAMDYLVSVSRAPTVEVQLALIELIQREGLTRREVRLLLNEVLASETGPGGLPALVAQVRSPSACGEVVPGTGPVRANGEQDGGQESGEHATEDGHGPAVHAAAGAPPERGGVSPTARSGERDFRPLGKENGFEPGRGPLKAADALEQQGEARSSLQPERVHKESERIAAKKAMEEWLREVEARLGKEEVTRIRKALGEERHTAQDMTLMRIMHMYKGILPEQLAGYLSQLKENMAQSPWFEEVVACSMKLLGLLGRPEEHKRLHSVPGQFFHMLLSELYRAAAPYDPDLAFYLDRISRFRKEEFATRPVAKG